MHEAEMYPTNTIRPHPIPLYQVPRDHWVFLTRRAPVPARPCPAPSAAPVAPGHSCREDMESWGCKE